MNHKVTQTTLFFSALLALAFGLWEVSGVIASLKNWEGVWQEPALVAKGLRIIGEVILAFVLGLVSDPLMLLQALLKNYGINVSLGQDQPPQPQQQKEIV